MRYINEIIVHCTATPENRSVSVDEIRRWHVEERGWSDIGYHYVIYLDGSIHEGRPVEQAGSHVAGRNANTVGVVYVGGGSKKPKDTRTTAQKEALVSLLKDLMQRFPSIKKISGHNQYAAKACPSFDAGKEYADLVKEPRHKVPASIKSRTVKANLAKGGLGLAVETNSVTQATAELESAQSQISTGTWIGLIAGVLIIGLAVYNIWVRWDDGKVQE